MLILSGQGSFKGPLKVVGLVALVTVKCGALNFHVLGSKSHAPPNAPSYTTPTCVSSQVECQQTL